MKITQAGVINTYFKELPPSITKLYSIMNKKNDDKIRKLQKVKLQSLMFYQNYGVLYFAVVSII